MSQYTLTLSKLTDFCKKVDDERMKNLGGQNDYAFLNSCFAATLSLAYPPFLTVLTSVRSIFTASDAEARADDLYDQIVKVRRFMANNSTRYSHVKVEVSTVNMGTSFAFKTISIYAVKPTGSSGWEIVQ